MPDSANVFCANDSGQADPCPAPGQDFFGQDGNYVDHPAQILEPPVGMGFAITDVVTGLRWRAVETTTFGDIDYDPADMTQCPSGWRLPTAYELVTIVDAARRQGEQAGTSYNMLPQLFIPAGLEEPVRLWTTTSVAAGRLVLGEAESTNCGADDRVGLVACNPNNPAGDPEYAYVCVSNETPARTFLPDDSMSGQATTVDDRTLLEWELGDAPGLNWQNALAYCDELVWGGHDDWRLPSFKEIGTWIGETNSLPTDLMTLGIGYWSSSPVNAGNTNSDEIFAFTPTGELSSSPDWSGYRARCVRGPLIDPAELPPTP